MHSLDSIIKSICKRPMMYTGQNTFMSVVSFLRGYLISNETATIEFDKFVKWLSQKGGYPEHFNWVQMLLSESDNDDEALSALSDLFQEFRKSNS